jgi:hypothetical protein
MHDRSNDIPEAVLRGLALHLAGFRLRGYSRCAPPSPSRQAQPRA